jgi:hypothetical protein
MQRHDIVLAAATVLTLTLRRLRSVVLLQVRASSSVRTIRV